MGVLGENSDIPAQAHKISFDHHPIVSDDAILKNHPQYYFFGGKRSICFLLDQKKLQFTACIGRGGFLTMQGGRGPH